MADQDVLLEKAQRGATAAMLKEQLELRVHERERQIIAAALAEITGRTLTGEKAQMFFAQIAGVRSLLNDVTREARDGQEARERLMSPSPSGTATRSR